MAMFQVNLGQPVPIEAKDDGGGGDNWTTGAISRAMLQPNHHHQQTNIQFFFTGRVPFLSPNQQCQNTGRSEDTVSRVYVKLLADGQPDRETPAKAYPAWRK